MPFRAGLLVLATIGPLLIPLTSHEVRADTAPHAADRIGIGSDAIEWHGTDCATMTVTVRLVLPPGVTEKTALVGSDDKCRPLLGPIQVATGSLAAGWSFIHTSHTLQDLPRLDLSWLRSTTARYWDGSSAFWDESGDMIGWSGNGPSWWLSSAPSWRSAGYLWHACPGTYQVCNWVDASVGTDFHVDFVHCNVINQTIRLTTNILARRDGGYEVEFTKTGSCPGVYSATGARSNETRSGGFGGGGVARCAYPHPTNNYMAQEQPCAVP